MAGAPPSENVNYKVWLLHQDQQQQQEAKSPSEQEYTPATPEVRRFVVDKDVSTSLVFLQEKCVDLFPRLRQDQFQISWTDEDGDLVRIGTDEELIIALTEMKGPLYKITVTITKQGVPSMGPGRSNSDASRDLSLIHI